MTQDMVKMMSQDKMIGKREILSSSPSPWFSRFLRTMLLLLMMTLGVGTTWGQEKDYSGMYYLANNNKKNNVYDYKGYNNSNNFYLRSADFYWNSDNDTPYLTTYQTGQDDVALWIVEKVENTDYYTFKQKDGEGYKYLTVNNAPTGSSNHRKRVHLETTTTVTDKNYFTIELITTQDGICGYSIGLGKDEYLNGTTNRYLNPAGGNMNSLSGGADRDGIIGFYTKGEIGSDSSGSIWFFEVPKPVIHIDGNNKLTFSCKNEDVTYYYTIDGDDPIATDANTYDESADNILSEGVHTIKVIAVMNSGNTGYASGVVTREVTIFSTEHPYLISNNQSAWTVGNETKNVFYMIPSDNNTVNTTSMPRPTMEWNISLAEEVSSVRYFYICNAMTGYYLYRSGNNLSMKTSLEKTELETASDNGFKFYVIKRAAETYHAGYSIVPYGETSKYVNKNSGNAEANALAIATNENDYSRWNFVAKDEVLNDPVLPFATSGEGTSSYYQIQNGKMDSDNIPYYIIPPASIPGNAAASKSEEAATVKSGSWYFMKVQDPVLENSDPSQIDWLTYYKVVNAETGKVLYYSFTANNSPCIKVGDYVENDGNYMFAFVKSPTTDYYYIVPKTVKDNQLANISCFWRDGSNMKPATTRKKDNNIWTFTPATLFCNDPEFVEEEGVIKIKCNTNGAKIYINTESDANPTNESTLYDPTDPENVDTQNWETTDQVRIKAIAVVSDGTNSVSSSVFTLLNNPDITLGGTAPYIYNASPWEPGVTEVSIGEASNKTSTTSGYSIAYSENHTDAGEVTVTVTDNVEDDLFIKNASTTFTIQRKGVTITASDASKTYNGSALTKDEFTATDLETGDPHTFTVVMTDASTITNVGTQPNVIATVDGVAVTTGIETTVGNYLVTTADGTLTVSAKAVTVTAKSASKAYNGSALTEGDFTASDLEAGDTHTFTVTMAEGSSITDVGTQPNVIATVDGTAVTTGTATTVGNYLVTTADGTLEVTAKAVSITANDASKVYDGTALTEDGFTATALEEGDTHTFTVVMTEGSTITNVGNTPNEIATVDGVTVTTGTQTAIGNYLVTTANGTLTVNPASVTLTANSRNTDVYDGTEKTVTGFTCKMGEQTVEGLSFGESVTASGSGTDAGDYVVTVTGVTVNETKDNTGNYVVTGTTNGTLTINPLTVEITWVGTDFAYTYNGNSQAPTATASGTINDEEIIVTIIPSAQDGSSLSEKKAVNVGSYIAKATALSNSNYTLYKNNSSTGDFIDNIEQAFTIVPAELTAVTIDQTELIYNGAEQTVTVTSIKAGELNVTDDDYVVSGNAQTNANAVGESYTVIVKAKENTTEPLYVNNFTGEVTTTFTIQPKPIGVGDDDVRPLASGFSVSVGEGNTIILKDGETPLTENIDYTVGVAESSASGRYSVRKITGQGNYGSFTNVRNAIVHFMNDGNGGSVYSATFVAEPAGAVAADDTKGHALSDGITAYIITAINGNTATTEALSYIPEGVPVLLLSNGDSNGFMVQDVSGQTAPTNTNLLKEVTEESKHFDVKTIYMLYRNEFVYNMAGDLSKGRVYLDPTPSSPSGARLVINWGEENGIDTSILSSLASPLPDTWHSLDGRRLNGKPTKKGLYIRNGQMVVIK